MIVLWILFKFLLWSKSVIIFAPLKVFLRYCVMGKSFFVRFGENILSLRGLIFGKAWQSKKCRHCEIFVENRSNPKNQMDCHEFADANSRNDAVGEFVILSVAKYLFWRIVNQKQIAYFK